MLLGEVEIQGRAMLSDRVGTVSKTTQRVIESLTDTTDTRTMAAETIETLSARIRIAVRERQALRETAADRDALERNRLEIVTLQLRLSEALIERYLPAAA
jgi:hypothetical protein